MKNRLKRNKLISAATAAITTVMVACAVSSAATQGPGEKIGSWLQAQAQGLFLGILGIVAIFLFITRKAIAAVITIAFAGLSAWILYSPDAFATTIKNIVSSWF